MPAPKSRRKHTLGAELLDQAWQYGRLMRLDRPIGTWLLLWPTLWGLWIAGEGHPDPRVFSVFVLGVIVMRAAGCVINDFADRRFDSSVHRTQDRPLASGKVSPVEAIVLFVALSLVAIGLVLTLNRLTQLLAVIGALVTIIYPFSKRYIHTPQLILGVAFAWGIPMAFAAQTGEVPRLAWLLWLTALVWIVAYDTIYAMVDREDDLLIGIKSTAILFGQADVFIVSLLQLLLLMALLLVGQTAGMGMWYLIGVGYGAVLMLYQHMLIRQREPSKCFRAFLNNNYFGGVIFAGIVLNYTFSGV
ncbi:MAG: 4-hydroxybenzoate octaprenyltransferase [Gammaproteobacteria bacterium]